MRGEVRAGGHTMRGEVRAGEHTMRARVRVGVRIGVGVGVRVGVGLRVHLACEKQQHSTNMVGSGARLRQVITAPSVE